MMHDTTMSCEPEAAAPRSELGASSRAQCESSIQVSRDRESHRPSQPGQPSLDVYPWHEYMGTVRAICRQSVPISEFALFPAPPPGLLSPQAGPRPPSPPPGGDTRTEKKPGADAVDCSASTPAPVISEQDRSAHTSEAPDGPHQGARGICNDNRNTTAAAASAGSMNFSALATVLHSNVDRRGPLDDPDRTAFAGSSHGDPSHAEAAGIKGASVLILLDMNGTLLYRAKEPLSLPDSAETFIAGSHMSVQYCIRPGALDLVGDILRHPRARLAFYTSMRKVNALPAIRKLVPQDWRKAPCPEVYDRPFNAPDAEGANHWDTVRDLPRIWSTPGRTGSGFGPHNTVMVDDTLRKMRYQSAGLVIVPEYTEASVMATYGEMNGQRWVRDTKVRAEGEDLTRREVACREAEILPRLAAYLRRLLDESGEDVRTFITQNPFQAHASSTSMETSSNPGCGDLASRATAPEGADSDTARLSVATPNGESSGTLTKDRHQEPRDMLSLIDAMSLLLSTGPLACFNHSHSEDQTAGKLRVAGSSGIIAAAPSSSSGSSSCVDAGVVVSESVGIDVGKYLVPGFDKSAAFELRGLLKEAYSVMGQWGLHHQGDRDRFKAWLDEAEAALNDRAS